MLKRTLLTALAAAATLGFAASAHAAYLNIGTNNPYSASTTLSGSIAGAGLTVQNGYGASSSAYALYGLLTAKSPSGNAPAIRGHNSSTNAHGFGVMGTQAGSGTGVYGYTPSGMGVWGNTSSGTAVKATSSSGFGVRASSTSGWGLYGTSSTGGGVFGTGVPGVKGQSSSGTSDGVLGTTSSGYGVAGNSSSSDGVYGQSATGAGVYGLTTSYAGVWGQGGPTGVRGDSSTGIGVSGTSGGTGTGVYGFSSSSNGVQGQSNSGDAVSASSGSTTASGLYAENTASTGNKYAAYLSGNLFITGGKCTGCAGPSALQIDDPLDPAHKYLRHSSVASSQQLDIYSGNVTTNAKGLATVTMPSWFQALNRSFRYQLTSLSGLQQVAVAKEMRDNRFTVQSQRPRSKVSWQVTAVRHDPYANANPTRVIVAKPKADQGKYVHPEAYGKAMSDGIGYRRPARPPSHLSVGHSR